MITTLTGRLQTKLFTYPLLGLVTLAFAWQGGEVYVATLAIAMVVGLVLELIWGVAIEYQPGYLTIVLGVIEFCVIALVALWLQVPLSLADAAVYYWTAWGIIQLFVIYLLPVWWMEWNERGGELW